MNRDTTVNLAFAAALAVLTYGLAGPVPAAVVAVVALLVSVGWRGPVDLLRRGAAAAWDGLRGGLTSVPAVRGASVGVRWLVVVFLAGLMVGRGGIALPSIDWPEINWPNIDWTDDENPEPEPTPDAPFPADGLHVLIVYESGDASKLTPDQRAILYGQDSRTFLDEVCPETGGQDTYRIYDQHDDVSAESKVWQDAMAVPRASLPWLVVSNGKTGFSGPLTMPSSEFKALVGKHK